MDALSWTVDDLELLPEDSNRYEVIDGELYVSKQPDMQHQIVATKVSFLLELWNMQTQLGLTIATPGIIFSNNNAVVPDVVWISNEQYVTALQPDGKFHTSPELMVEMLSPGAEDRRRARELKLKLYSRYGAEEYWVIDWQQRRLEVYKRENAILKLDRTLKESDVLETPLLPGFHCKVGQFFNSFP